MSEVLTNEQIVEALKQKTLLEVNELVKLIESTFGVSAAAPVAMAAAPAGGGAQAAEAAEEKTEFTVILKDAGKEKIKVIKEVRVLTNLGLKEAKDLVEACPKEVLKDVSKDDAAAAKKKLEEAGAVVEVK